jgi:hypothetical protein
VIVLEIVLVYAVVGLAWSGIFLAVSLPPFLSASSQPAGGRRPS